MIQLLAIRHAPVTVERIFYGQTDVPTTLDATEAAARIGHTVAEFAPDTIWSSDAVPRAEVDEWMADWQGRSPAHRPSGVGGCSK